MVARPVFAVLLITTGLPQQLRAETVLSCRTETDSEVSRRICVPVPKDGGIRIYLPDPPPPVKTNRNGAGLGVTLDLPPPPPAVVAIPPRDLVMLAPPAPPRPVLPPFPIPPAVAVVPPPTPPAPAARPPAEEPSLPTPPSQAETSPEPRPFPAMPAEVLESALRRLRGESRLPDREVDQIVAYYRARDFRPLWLEEGRWGARARSVRAVLTAAAEDGMDPARYRTVSDFVAPGEPQWPALAAAEAQLSAAAVLYAREAAIGRVRPAQVSAMITPQLHPPAAEAVLGELTEAEDVSAALRSFQPRHSEFQRLREALAAARANRRASSAGEPIPDGPALRVGMRDPRVPLIRARLGLGYDDRTVYDREVAVRVASLQRANGLPVNGLFTPQTRRVLAGEAPTRDEAEIIVNMEFWRWMPRELGTEHIFVNTPAYEMRFIRDGRPAFEARVIVGKEETQTPFFSDEMDHIVVNPSWWIPPGILEREPKYLDPAYAAARGYEIRVRGSVTTVRVPPGSSNALGYVKFVFPNDHAVYLHDTPNRGLFNASVRALSNGCVRVENPMRLAALLFERDGYTEERFRRMQGGGERRMNLSRKMPVHLGYFTLTGAEDGTIQRHPDIYGHAARMRQILNLS